MHKDSRSRYRDNKDKTAVEASNLYDWKFHAGEPVSSYSQVVVYTCTLLGKGEENCSMYYKANLFSHNLSNTKHFSVFVENNYLVLFENTDYWIMINHFTTNPGYRQICVDCILTRSEVKTDLMIANMKHNIIPSIFTIILPNVLTLCYPLHSETSTAIY